MRRLVMLATAMVAWCAVADVPTQAEFTAAGNVIADLMEPQMAAMKSGKKKPAEVADYAMSLVGECDTAAAKFLLARRAYGLYMKGGAYDKAVGAIGGMREAVPDMPNERMLKAIQPAAQNVSEKKAAAVLAIVDDLKGKVWSQDEIAKLNGLLKKAKEPERAVLHQQLGERYAALGDWDAAFDHFFKSEGEIALMAKSDKENKAEASYLAGFWWDYSESPVLNKYVAAALRQHAVELYKKGIADGTISGLNKKLAEQRVAGKKAEVGLSAALPPKQHIPKGLAHRWSFNDSPKDLIGVADAEICGKSKWENGQCVLNRGWIRLHGAVDSFRGDFTLEIWTTEIERTKRTRVFYLLPDRDKIKKDAVFAWATGTGKDGYFHADHYAIVTPMESACRGFDLGKETYIAMTCKSVGNKYEISTYKYDIGEKKFSTFVANMNKDRVDEIKYFTLGPLIRPARGFSDAISSFNECRVWKRCLSKSEIERSAKAGPDKLVL